MFHLQEKDPQGRTSAYSGARPCSGRGRARAHHQPNEDRASGNNRGPVQRQPQRVAAGSSRCGRSRDEKSFRVTRRRHRTTDVWGLRLRIYGVARARPVIRIIPLQLQTFTMVLPAGRTRSTTRQQKHVREPPTVRRRRRHPLQPKTRQRCRARTSGCPTCLPWNPCMRSKRPHGTTASCRRDKSWT